MCKNVNYVFHLSTRIITDPKFVEAHLKYFLNTCWFMCTFTKKASIDIISWFETEYLFSLHWCIWIITLMEMDGVLLLDPLLCLLMAKTKYVNLDRRRDTQVY